MSTCDLMCLGFCQTKILAERDGRMGRAVATSSPAHTRAFFFFYFQLGSPEMPQSGLVVMVVVRGI